ncbi:hypothetical protein [Helicobacter sp. 11S03491-1]|uniref:hypothetical protein n=1 Tax=Helicobacter sp. 11S03491-1 TaxID=1476196 RepID=UPI000BA6AE21|nr:hypothetical protein [Helicobacter sp. 11S03491-1]PAF42182.1 hypothetical protein BKH45_04340 [Helicobacter sp. 11S03491-1]
MNNPLKNQFKFIKTQKIKPVILGICGMAFLGCTNKYYEMYKSPCACLDKKKIQHIQKNTNLDSYNNNYLKKFEELGI